MLQLFSRCLHNMFPQSILFHSSVFVGICFTLLHGRNRRYPQFFRWKTWSCKDALWTLLLWCILVAARYIPCAWNSLAEGRAFAEWTDLPRLVSHALLTGILVVASFWQVRTSHAMLLILNSWIASLLGGEIDCMEAKHQWRRVSGLFRKTSRTFEHCFAALASLIVALALSALYDLRQGSQSFMLGPWHAETSICSYGKGSSWKHCLRFLLELKKLIGKET